MIRNRSYALIASAGAGAAFFGAALVLSTAAQAATTPTRVWLTVDEVGEESG